MDTRRASRWVQNVHYYDYTSDTLRREPRSEEFVVAEVCLPLIRPIGLTPPAAGIRDAVHRRAALSPPCPGSAAAHSEARVRL
jgi:hypothetical protein